MLAPERLYGLLECPRCGRSPEPQIERCPGCGALVMAPGGGLDLLDDDAREAADRFAEMYRSLRMREGWADSSGREDPHNGPSARQARAGGPFRSQLWKTRFKSAAKAAAILARERTPGVRPVVADVGSGGGWMARLLEPADVIAFDLLDVRATGAALTVRADMRALPLREASVDAVVYAASLHYSPLADAVAEAARVVGPHGLMVAFDSPIYPDTQSQTRAIARTAAYYASVGYSELRAQYHPIDARALRSVLVACGFEIERLEMQGPIGDLWRRWLHEPPSTLVVARRLR